MAEKGEYGLKVSQEIVVDSEFFITCEIISDGDDDLKGVKWMGVS
jgi:hypothetical protein